MKVAGIQFDIAWENPGTNLKVARGLIERAADAGADLVVLPEMFATAFSMDTAKILPFEDEIREFLSSTAKAAGVWLIAGLAAAQKPRPKNIALVIDPSGAEQLRYEKIHPFSLAGEPEHYDAGRSVSTIEIKGLRVTPFVCYDLRFPEIFRFAADDTDLFVVIANWPERRSEAWMTLLRSRAIENQAYVLGVNRIGEAGGIAHLGDSSLVDPFGNVASTLVGSEGIVSGEADRKAVAACRQRFSFLEDRRPEIYDRIAREKRGDVAN
ncbi:MAG: nitrilase-related carbon-nitrogen hydrolase [Planctomycetota bacterium]